MWQRKEKSGKCLKVQITGEVYVRKKKKARDKKTAISTHKGGGGKRGTMERVTLKERSKNR